MSRDPRLYGYSSDSPHVVDRGLQHLALHKFGKHWGALDPREREEVMRDPSYHMIVGGQTDGEEEVQRLAGEQRSTQPPTT